MYHTLPSPSHSFHMTGSTYFSHHDLLSTTHSSDHVTILSPSHPTDHMTCVVSDCSLCIRRFLCHKQLCPSCNEVSEGDLGGATAAARLGSMWEAPEQELNFSVIHCNSSALHD